MFLTGVLVLSIDRPEICANYLVGGLENVRGF